MTCVFPVMESELALEIVLTNRMDSEHGRSKAKF